MTRRIQRSNLYDRKRSNPTVALSQTHFAFLIFLEFEIEKFIAE